MNTRIKNLLKVFALASTNQIETHARWYYAAHDMAESWAIEFNIPIENVVGIIAVLSPCLSWGMNIAAAREVLSTGDTKLQTGENREKARRCLAGDLSAIQGPKVTRFYESILRPESTQDIVVVDVWMNRIMLGNITGSFTPPAPKGRVYLEMQDDVREAAALVGLTPQAFQAVTWEVVRSISKKNVNTFPV